MSVTGDEWIQGDPDPWRVEEYGGQPVAPRVFGEEDDLDFARIGFGTFVLEPVVWFLAGFALRGTAWLSVWDILGYWMVLFVMLPLRLLDTEKPRDLAFRIQYMALQLLALAGGYLGWRLAGGPGVY
jgi:hypothetical protein